MSVQSGSTAVNGTVTASGTFTPTKVSGVLLHATRGSAGTSTLGTVPAGKVWRILSAFLSVATHSSADNSTTYLTGGSGKLLGLDDRGSATYQNGGHAVGLAWGYEACPVLVAGETVTLVTVDTYNSTGGVCYVEEAA